MLDERKPRALPALLLLLAALPAIFTGISILLYGVDTPLWDEWLIGGYLNQFAQGTLSFHSLFEQQNEYRQFFPNLIFVALGWLTNWDVRSWMVLSFLLAGMVSYNIYHLGKWSLGDNPSRAAGIYLVANLIIFSPVQHENWLQGQQLVYFLPIACFTASLLVASATDLRIGTRFTLCAIAAIISSFSSANGMLCWGLLLPALAWSSSRDELWRKRWWIVAWVAGFVLTLVFYFHDFRSPPQHDPLAWTQVNPLRNVLYFLGILGRPLAPGRLLVAAPLGFVFISIYVWSCLRFWKLARISTSQALRLLCWLMLGAYSVLTAALITIGRVSQDPERGLAVVRYTTYSLYLPVALLYLIPIILEKGSKELRVFNFRFSTRRLLALLGVALVLIHLPIYLLGIRQMSSFRALSLQSKACALFVNVLQDECLTERVYPDIETLKRKINPADRLGLIRPGLIKSDRVQDIQSLQTQGQNKYGAFQSLIQLEADQYVASGWANLPERGEPADVVLLAYEQAGGPPIIFVIAPTNIERDIVSALFRRGIYGDSRWSKSFSLGGINPDRAKLTAWGFDAYTGKAYKLEGEHVFQKSTGYKRK